MRNQLTSQALRLSLAAMLFACVSTLSLHAQGGSNYTVFGFGDLRQSVGAAYEGLGGSVYSTPSDYAINTANPALWTDVKTTRLQAGYRFNQLIVSQGSSSVGNNNGKLDGATVIFALDTTAGISGCLGMYPSSSINYLFSKPVQIALADGTVVKGSSQYQGEGGMVTGFIGAACKLSDRISVGASGLLHFGSINDRITTSIQTESSFNSITTNGDRLFAAGVNLGVQTIPFENFTLGAAAVLNGNLSYSSDLNYLTADNSNVVSYDSTLTTDHSSAMPTTFGLGASYRSGKFLFVADAELQQFSSVTYRLSSFGNYASGSRFSIGLSRIGSHSAGTAYFDRANFNFGLGYRALGYEISGKHISETFGSVGAQLPFGGAAMVDLALVVGRRGTTDNNLLGETFFRFSFTMSVGETWFIPFRRE